MFILLAAASTLVIAQQTTSLEHSVSTFWNSLSNAPQSAPDIATMQHFFAENAIVAGNRAQNGKEILEIQSATSFMKRHNRLKEKGFYECEIAREIRVTHRFATVLSLVESRQDPDQPQADFTGINSMQWSNNGGVWKLISLYYYLPPTNDTLTILNGTTGHCINTIRK